MMKKTMVLSTKARSSSTLIVVLSLIVIGVAGLIVFVGVQFVSKQNNKITTDEQAIACAEAFMKESGYAQTRWTRFRLLTPAELLEVLNTGISYQQIRDRSFNSFEGAAYAYSKDKHGWAVVFRLARNSLARPASGASATVAPNGVCCLYQEPLRLLSGFEHIIKRPKSIKAVYKSRN
jgi:hypothetical protein